MGVNETQPQSSDGPVNVNTLVTETVKKVKSTKPKTKNTGKKKTAKKTSET